MQITSLIVAGLCLAQATEDEAPLFRPGANRARSAAPAASLDEEAESPREPASKSVLRNRKADDTGADDAPAKSGSRLAPVDSAQSPDSASKAARASDRTASNASAARANTIDAAVHAAATAGADLMTRALAADEDSALTGRPLALVDALARGADRNRQLWITRGYWKLSAAAADYNWTLEELKRLDEIVADKDAVDSPLLATARAESLARRHEALAAAVAAQQELADFFGQPSNEPLPLPADAPLVGPYRTHFDALFAARAPPPRTRLIDRTLPIRREAIDNRVAAIQAASSAVRSAEAAHQGGQVGLSVLLGCHSELWRQRRAFLAAVRDYNQEVAEYALAVADPGTPREKLVGMLIRARPATRLSSVSQEPTLADPRGAPAGEPTLADQKTDPAVRPAAATDPDGWAPSRVQQAGGAEPAKESADPSADPFEIRPDEVERKTGTEK